MENMIVIVILVILIGSAASYLIKAKKNGVRCVGCPAGGSCPGSRKMPEKKLDGPVIGRRTMRISGMHCEHCVADVTTILNQIDGVRAEVNLSAGSAKVSYDREIVDDLLKSAVEKAGYRVISIQ